MPDQTLDATGLKCPMPVLRARRALKRVQIQNSSASKKSEKSKWIGCAFTTEKTSEGISSNVS